MTDICRLCASLKTLEQLVLLDEPNLLLKTKLAKCCAFEIPEHDEYLPQNVCKDCMLCLNKSWSFAEKVLQSQDILKKAFLIEFDGIKTCENVYNTSNDSNVGESCSAIKDLQEISFKTRSSIISLHIKGYTNDEISKRLKIAESAVRDWVFTYQSHTYEQQSIELCDEENPEESVALATAVVVLPPDISSVADKSNDFVITTKSIQFYKYLCEIHLYSFLEKGTQQQYL